MPELVSDLRRILYVDNLISEKPTVIDARQLKQVAIEIFAEATFTLHKWNSNVANLGDDESIEDESMFAKQQQLGQTERQNHRYHTARRYSCHQEGDVEESSQDLRPFGSRSAINREGQALLQRSLQLKGGMGRTTATAFSEKMGAVEEGVATRGDSLEGFDP